MSIDWLSEKCGRKPAFGETDRKSVAAHAMWHIAYPGILKSNSVFRIYSDTVFQIYWLSREIDDDSSGMLYGIQRFLSVTDTQTDRQVHVHSGIAQLHCTIDWLLAARSGTVNCEQCRDVTVTRTIWVSRRLGYSSLKARNALACLSGKSLMSPSFDLTHAVDESSWEPKNTRCLMRQRTCCVKALWHMRRYNKYLLQTY